LRRAILGLLIMLISVPAVFAAESMIRKVLFEGEKKPGQILLASKVGNKLNSDSLTADSLKIVKYYQRQAWFDCQVSISVKQSGNEADIGYKIITGNRYALEPKLISLGTNDSILAKVEIIRGQYDGLSAISENIENLVGDIVDTYAESGYPYCDAKVNNLSKVDSIHLKLNIDIQPGPYVQIMKLEFPGRKNLDQKFLEEYCGLLAMTDYSTSMISLAARRLSLAPFLKEAGGFELRYSNSPERGVIYFPVKEKSPLVLDGGLGFASKGTTFYGRISGVISNILGKGRQAEFFWSKKDKASRTVRLGYLEPYAFGQPFRLDVSVSQDDRDSLYIESKGSFGLSYLASNTYVYGVSIGGSQISPETYGKSVLASKNRYWVAVNFSADTRDYPINPKGGEYYYLEGNFATENIQGDSVFSASSGNYQTVKLNIQKSLPVSKSSSLYAGLLAQGDFSSVVPVDRQFPLGGFGSLRGYNQDFYYVSKYALFTFEYRLLTSRDGRAYIFGDMATFQLGNLSSTGSQTKVKAGFGLGLAAIIQPGLATIEFAIPSDGGIGETKIHFGIKAGF
jgi:outer membrane protein assembly factor BamA